MEITQQTDHLTVREVKWLFSPEPDIFFQMKKNPK